MGHIFRDAPGHVNPKAGTIDMWVEAFESVAKNTANARIDGVEAGIITQAAKDAGVKVFTETLNDGSQIWVTAFGKSINNAGVNPVGAIK